MPFLHMWRRLAHLQVLYTYETFRMPQFARTPSLSSHLHMGPPVIFFPNLPLPPSHHGRRHSTSSVCPTRAPHLRPCSTSSPVAPPPLLSHKAAHSDAHSRPAALTFPGRICRSCTPSRPRGMARTGSSSLCLLLVNWDASWSSASATAAR